MLYPLFEVDWNAFYDNEAWVRVPQHAYDSVVPFQVDIGDRCILIETEEMTGCFGVVLDFSEDRVDENGTPMYVKVRLLSE